MEEIGNEIWFIKLKGGKLMCISKTEKEKYSKFIDIKENDIVEYVNFSQPELSSNPDLLPIERLQKIKDCYKLRDMPLKTDACFASLSLINQRLSLLTDYYINPLEYDICYITKNLYKSTYNIKIDSIVQEKLNYGKNIDNYFYYLRFLVRSKYNSVDHYFLVVVNTSYNVIKNIYVFDTGYYPSFESLWLKRTILLYFRKTNKNLLYYNPLTYENIDTFNNIYKINEQYKSLHIQSLETQLVKTGYCSAWSTYFIWRTAIKKEPYPVIYDNLSKLSPIERLSLIMIWWSLVENSITWEKSSDNPEKPYIAKYDKENFFDLGGEFPKLLLGNSKDGDVAMIDENPAFIYKLHKFDPKKFYTFDEYENQFDIYYLYFNIGIPIITLNETLKNGNIYFRQGNPEQNIYDYLNIIRLSYSAFIEDFDNLTHNKSLYDIIIELYKTYIDKSNNIIILENYLNIIANDLKIKIKEYNDLITDDYNIKEKLDEFSKYLRIFYEKTIKYDYNMEGNFTILKEVQFVMHISSNLYFLFYTLKDIYHTIIIYFAMLDKVLDLMTINLPEDLKVKYLEFINTTIVPQSKPVSYLKHPEISQLYEKYTPQIPENIIEIAKLINYEIPNLDE